MSKCCVCKNDFDDSEMYEYRGILACSKDFKKATERRDFERAEVIAENNHQTKPFVGLDLSGSIIGKANRSVLSTEIEIAQHEGSKTKLYERGSQ